MCDKRPEKCSRRQFVKETGALLGGLAAGASLSLSDAAAAPPGNVKVPQSTLGRTGEKVSRLGIGCAHFQRTDISIEEAGNVLYRGLELGVNYIDVAPNYGTPETSFSEEKIGHTIKKIRDKVFLVTKVEADTYEGTWQLLRQSMKRLQTDHFDLVHIHNFGHEPRFPDLKLVLGKKGTLGALQEAKKLGVVRFIGASGHLYPSRFHAVLDTGEIDVLMNATNLVTRHVYNFEDKVWSRARREKIGLVSMKILGGTGPGRNGFRLPENLYMLAMRYALSIPDLAVAVVGMQNIAELEKAAQTVATAQPLSETEAYEAAKIGLALAGKEQWKAPYGEPVA